MLDSTSNIFRVDLGEKNILSSNTLRTNLLDVITYSAAISACEKAHEFLERFFLQSLGGCCSTDRWWKRIGVALRFIGSTNTVSWYFNWEVKGFVMFRLNFEVFKSNLPVCLFWIQLVFGKNIHRQTIGQSEKWEHKANLIDTVHWRPFNDSWNQRR